MPDWLDRQTITILILLAPIAALLAGLIWEARKSGRRIADIEAVERKRE